MERSEIAVIGLGNLLMRDEGIGLVALGSLETGWSGSGVDFVHAGTPSMGLLHHFEGRRKIIFLDGGFCGTDSGTFRRFRPDDVKSMKGERKFSLHEFDLIRLIDVAERLGLIEHTEVVIYCMEICDMELGDELSEEVRTGLPAFIDALVCELEESCAEECAAY
jgi:hydrogenase maturation protease